ncbi:hypothetical protein MMC15_004444 [Xylographa vitiligo]|nr:hypothetical protein [Xylographa vitiligo]
MSSVLPPELLFNIVAQIGDLQLAGTPLLSDLSSRTLRNLRLVNKAVHGFATPYLFHTITTWLTQYQFERLRLISNKEHLRHHIRRIIFRPWEVRNIGGENYLTEIWCCDLRTHNRVMPTGLTFANFNDYVQNFAMLRLTDQERSGYGVLGTVPEIRQMWSPRTYTEEFLRQGEQEYLRAYYIQVHRRANYAIDRAQLKDAFVSFDNLTHIMIAPGEATPENNRFVHMTGIAPYPYWYRNGTYLISTVIASLEVAKAKLRYLEIDTGRNEHHFWDEIVFDIFVHGYMNEYLLPFAGLEKLCITNIGRWVTNRPSRSGLVLLNHRPIAKLLEATLFLKELTLGLHKNWRNLCGINAMFPTTLVIQGLRILTLHWFAAKEESLFQILDSHKWTLRSLNLHNITIAHGTWSSLALSIRVNLKLTDANLSGTWVPCQSPGQNNTVTAISRLQRSCFAFQRDPDLAGSLDDYITRKIDYDPVTRATDTGYQDEQDDWLQGTAAKEGWVPDVAFMCRCNKHMQIPDF